MDTNEPLLNRRFDLALHFASGLHYRQVRKGTTTPYVAHLLGVCALVLESGGDEDQAIAALLHDAMEDQGGLPTLDTIERLFGEPVAKIVRECSDSETADREHKPPWQERKQAYVARLRVASSAALLVSAADKVHNARDILAAYRQIGDEVWRRFKASKADQLRYYRDLVSGFQARRESPNALVAELDRVVTTLEAG